jgi:hypothetical protein
VRARAAAGRLVVLALLACGAADAAVEEQDGSRTLLFALPGWDTTSRCASIRRTASSRSAS